MAIELCVARFDDDTKDSFMSPCTLKSMIRGVDTVSEEQTEIEDDESDVQF